MLPFLKSIAKAYASRYSDLSEFCFVFPNKRAGTFFLNRLRSEAIKKPILAPRVTSISELVEELSGRTVDNKIDLLFILYNAYRKIGGERDTDNFDSFRAWGETILNDFGEIDMYGVNPDEIFKNLKDYREISSNYLTEEQRRVMEEYFGYKPGVESDAESFWKTFEPESAIKGNFLLLWQHLAPLYHAFERELEAEGLTTTSGAYRLTLERLRKPDAERPARKMVFVGFNALSLVEREIMKEMTEFEDFNGPEGPEPSTDFFWDGTGPVLSPSAPENSPSHFLRLNRREFPHPDWAEPFLKESETTALCPEIRVISAPSRAIQAKIVGSELRRLNEELPSSDFKKAKVAVVLPDESLLIPLLYSLPENGSDINLTMGYPLRLTSASSFVTVYRLLQRGIRRTADGPAFYHQSLRKFIGHPFVHAVAGSLETAALNSWLNKTHRLLPSLEDITSVAPRIASLITPLPEKAGYRDAAILLTDTLNTVVRSLERNGDEGIIKGRLDQSHIKVYLDAVRILVSTIGEHEIEMSAHSFFVLADRMLGSEQVTFEGEPLQGLQVMGMLETRALDFDRVIIPSANEKYLPVKGRNKSFLPNSLRAAYHMPPMQHQENLASYYFYRLISRAKEVVIIYDSRNGNGVAGEPSRYIAQLEYLYAKGNVRFENRILPIAPRPKAISTIQKSPGIMEALDSYLNPESKSRLAFTSFQSYCQCGLKFFFERIAGIRTDTAPSEYIDSKTQGDVIHEAMMNLYLPSDKQRQLLDPGIVITSDFIRKLIADKRLIKTLVRRSINRRHFLLQEDEQDRPLPRTSELIATNLEWYILNILTYDLSIAPFTLLGCEISGNISYPMEDGREVNFTFAIDRLDQITAPDGEVKTRIVDYKTSSLEPRDFKNVSADNIFDGDSKSKYPLQLMLYTEFLNSMLRKEGKKEITPERVIYNIPKMRSYPVIILTEEGDPCPQEESGDERIDTPFTQAFKAKLTELFDPSEPFRAPADEEDACKYCSLKPLCRR